VWRSLRQAHSIDVEQTSNHHHLIMASSSASNGYDMRSLLDCFCHLQDPKWMKRVGCLEDDDDTESYRSSDDDLDDSEYNYDDSTTNFDGDGEYDGAEAVSRPLISDQAQTVLQSSNVFGSGMAALAGRAEAFQQLMKRDLNAEANRAMMQAAANGNNGGGAAVRGIRPSEKSQGIDHPRADTKPSDVLKSILNARGKPSAVIPFKDLQKIDFFLVPTEEQIAAYDMETTTAIRNHDVDAVKVMWTNGKILQCFNRFGESILHGVARRGDAQFMEFLLDTAECDVRVVCENGRTPLHDGCWTTTPNFDCLLMIIRQCPDLMLVGDKRGFAPLDYVPRDAWGPFCDFLDEHADELVPKEIV